MRRPGRRATLLYICGIALLGGAWYLLISDQSARLFEGLVPLQQPLTAQGSRGSFVAVWNEPHQVEVRLPTHSGIPEVDALVQRASDLVGHPGKPVPFDLIWRVYEQGVLVGSGSGRRGPVAIGLGGQFRDFAFGTFPVTAGKRYDVAVEVGPGFTPLLRARPAVEVSVATATASVGLAFARPIAVAVRWVVAALGLVALAAGAWYHGLQRGRPTRR
jgi:hypothetical protein